MKKRILFTLLMIFILPILSKAETCTITFVMNGGSYGGNPHAPMTVTCGDFPPGITTPDEREGYTFVGWYTDPAFSNSYAGIDRINSDLTLYAKWEQSESGDINNDGTFSIQDVSYYRGFLAGNIKVTLSDDVFNKADMNGDGNINLPDLVLARIKATQLNLK